MTLTEYLKQHHLTQHTFGQQAGVTQSAVVWWLKGKISPKRAAHIEHVTKGLVTRRDLRPDDWHLIWPELSVPPDSSYPSSGEIV